MDLSEWMPVGHRNSGAGRALGAARVGEGGGLPVEWVHLQGRGPIRSFEHSSVGEGAGVSVGQVDLQRCRGGRPLRSSPMGSRTRVPMG